ncbi:MAG: precorrin-6A/cobalt-precorrin-6A reductase [Pseudomonadota bacterium]
MTRRGSGSHIRVLILAGTREARELATHLAADDRFRVISSLKGITLSPQDYPGDRVIGGFGGAVGLADFLQAERVDALVNASHPFAAQMARNARKSAEWLGLPFLRLRRMPWSSRPGDHWQQVSTLEAAATALPPGAVAFLAVGSKGAEAFRSRSDVNFLIRTADPVPECEKWGNARYLTGLPAASTGLELSVLRGHDVTHLVARNSGGIDGYGKIAAAREIGMPVIMIDPPAEPAAIRKETAGAAYRWLVGQFAAGDEQT